MREIKFRAWDKVDNRMLAWEALDDWHDINNIFGEGADPTEINKGWGLKRYIPLQYTNLKDKNGVEIFRDDLTKINGAIYQVVYLNGAYGFVDVKSGDFWQYACNLATSSFGEVIGNVYEHSHLLDS